MSRRKLVIAVLGLAVLFAVCMLATAFYGTQAERAGPAVAWEKTFDNGYYDYGSMVRQTSGGGFVVTGGASPAYMGDRDALLIRTDGNGSLLWQKAFGGDGTMKGYDVFVAPDGGYVIVGEAGPGKLYQGLLIKTDAGGNEEYRHTYGSARDVFVRSGTPTADGAMVLAGSAGDRDDVETWDVCLIKTGRL